MPELEEVFDMVTKQTEPDLDAWHQQERRMRRATRNRRLGAIGLVATLGVAAVMIVLASRAGQDRVVDVGVPGVHGTPPTLETVSGIWLFDG
ncbi:MAG TPA: hypothetical protein VFZ75_07440 [Actinomycetota bacterium]|nr:hypothetical protein [Actinomycetota bacterium]